MTEYIDTDPFEKRRKALSEMNLRYDEVLCCYVTFGGKTVLTKKKWFEMTATERQDFVKKWQGSGEKQETWRDRPPLL